jgi:hypothetical protein
VTGFPLHARFAHPDYGYEADQRQAAERLTVGEVYTVQRLEVGRSSSAIFFYEVDNPQFGFNTVLFEPDDGEPFADTVVSEVPR